MKVVMEKNKMEKQQETKTEEQEKKKSEETRDKWFTKACLGGLLVLIGISAYSCNKETIERPYEKSIQNLTAVKRYTKNGTEYLSIPFHEKEIKLFYHNGEYLSTNKLNEIYQKRAKSVLLEEIE